MEGVPDLNDHIGVDIVFETIITSRKKKWALKDKKFAERIVQRYGMSMQLMDYFNDSDYCLTIIKHEGVVRMYVNSAFALYRWRISTFLLKHSFMVKSYGWD